MGKCTKDKRDIYYRLAKVDGYRARSAYKLIQIAEEYDIFDGVIRAVDLCAAPGSWSQVIVQNVTRTVAIDIQKMAPISGVIQLQGDITVPKTADIILGHLEGKADLVVCDGAPDITGMHYLDEYYQFQLLIAAIKITEKILRKEGTFVAKIFVSNNIDMTIAQMECIFETVNIKKPSSSRLASAEAFIICKKYKSIIIDNFVTIGDLNK